MIAMLAGRAAPGQSIPLAPQVDLGSMMGGWYIVATIPNWFEKGMFAPYDVYSMRPDGDIREDFYLRSGGPRAKLRHFTVRDRVQPRTNNASWRVEILWPIRLPFLVLYTDPAYRYVLFGENDRSLGWVYSRTPTIGDADYQALLERFAALGYDPTRFRKVVQRPEQIGQPGYWSDGIH
jgi:apolipoprotein D and lipocalin family protein